MVGARVEVVLVKLCAVVIVILSLQSLTRYAAYFMAGEDALELTVLAFIFVFAIPFGIAALLWFFPATVVGIQPAPSEGPQKQNARSNGEILVGVTLIGLYALVFGIVDFFYYEAVRVAEAAYVGHESYEPTPDTAAGRYTNIVQILLGLSLLLGRRGISDVLSRVRGRATDGS